MAAILDFAFEANSTFFTWKMLINSQLLDEKCNIWYC